MIVRALTLLAALCTASGCLVVDNTPPPAGNPNGPPDTCGGSCITRPPTGYPVSPIEVGVGVQGQLPDGFIITANAGSYRITWAGFQEFSGEVWITGGTPQFVAGCRDGSCSLDGAEDYVVVGSEAGRVDFDSFPASGKRSGFDLLYAGDLVLELEVNHQPRPDLVFFVSAITHEVASAPGMPFGLTM